MAELLESSRPALQGMKFVLAPGRAEAAPTAHEEFKHSVIVVPVTNRERIDADSALSESTLQNLV